MTLRGLAYGGRVRPLPALGLDVLVVVAFAAAGRRTHAGEVDVAGVLGTAAPFLAALAAGWLALRAWRDPDAVLRTGVPLWLVTLVGGMVLRRLAGEGTATPFVVVAALVLAAGLVGWRLLAAVPRQRSRASSSSARDASSQA